MAKANLKDHRGAILDYDHAIEINPKEALYYQSRGVSKSMQDDYRAAIQDYTRAIELNPEDAKSYYNRGVSYAKLRKSPERNDGSGQIAYR